MPSQSATPQQRQAQRFQQTDPAVDRAESDVGFPETYSSLAGPQQQSLGQSYTASKSAAAVLKGPAQGSSESGQGYGGSLEQQNWNGVQPSKSPQVSQCCAEDIPGYHCMHAEALCLLTRLG